MASSDADIKLKATLDSSDVTTGLRQIGQEAPRSLDSAASSGTRLAKSLDAVGHSAKASSQQITSMAVAMSGMAMRLGASVLESRGQSTAARYVEGAGAMAMQGAATLAPLGPQAAAAGALGGAAIGAVKTYFDLETEAKAREEALEATAAANDKALASFERLRASQNETADFYARIADDSMDAAQKQAALADRMKQFAAAAEELRGKLKSDEVQRDGKAFAETMREYAAALKQVDQATATQREIAQAGRDMDDAGTGRSETLSDALTRIGGSVGGGGMGDIAGIQREGVNVAREQLGVLREIKSEGLGTWA